jgi:hypothetical protein
MNTSESNGNTRLRVERGVSLAQRKIGKHARAVIAADILDGLALYQPTQQELAWLLRVSSVYIARARKLTPNQRAVIRQWACRDPAISNRPKALPSVVDAAFDDDVVDAVFVDPPPKRIGNGTSLHR